MGSKTETKNAETIEEALQNAGSSVLTHLGSNADKVKVDDVRKYEEENGLRGAPKEGEHRSYTGPYTDPEDERNVWTAERDLNGVARVTEQLPKQTKQEKPAATTAAAQRPPERKS